MNVSSLKDIYKIKLYELYQEANASLLAEISILIAPNADEIAQHFYRRMLNNDYAVKFLTHEEVKTRLQMQMTRWIINLFEMKAGDSEIDTYIEKQIQVGSVHSRIGLPISLVSYGMDLIKDYMCIVLFEANFSKEKLFQSVMLVNGLVDAAHSLINESYIGSTVVGEKNIQSFRLHVSDHTLAFDCERLRTSLLDWLRCVLMALHQQVSDLESVPTILHSEFGLWTTHKGLLVLGDREELHNLLACIKDIDHDMRLLIQCRKQNIPFSAEMNQLSQHVSRATWLLGNISKEIVEIDNGRDVLTKLFNRRYLETVMRHEVEFSLKHNLRFAMIYVDIDHFKQVNDHYGHENGDLILSKLSELLLQQVRSSDFVFRMGGEEFLIVLSDIQQKSVLRIAEQIRAHIAGSVFELNNGTRLEITVSLGVALHDGHPDYTKTMNKADAALYASKNSGRNKVTLL